MRVHSLNLNLILCVLNVLSICDTCFFNEIVIIYSKLNTKMSSLMCFGLTNSLFNNCFQPMHVCIYVCVLIVDMIGSNI